MLRKRYYILFVARDEDGRVRKIPLPLRYVYGFVAAALIGTFTIVGLAGSYTRMLLKTERFNQVRQDNQNLRKDYKQLAQVAHDRDVQVASLGALASEVTALYGLRQHKVIPAKASSPSLHGRGFGYADEILGYVFTILLLRPDEGWALAILLTPSPGTPGEGWGGLMK